MLKCLNLCSLSVLHSSNMIFIFDETKNKPHFKEIHTLNYNIMQMIFSCGIFFLFVLLWIIKLVFAKWRCLIWSLAPWARHQSLWALYVRFGWALECVRSDKYAQFATNRMEFWVITVIVNLWVGKQRKFTSIKIYHMKVKY